MKKIAIILMSVLWLGILTSCGVDNKIALVGIWHQDFESLPANYDTLSLLSDGRLEYKQFKFQDEENYVGSGPSGCYGTVSHKLVVGVTGSSTIASEGYELSSEEDRKIAQSNGLPYPKRYERFYEIKGDRLTLYMDENKTENTGELLTGVFHRGKPADCPLLKDKATGLMY